MPTGRPVNPSRRSPMGASRPRVRANRWPRRVTPGADGRSLSRRMHLRLVIGAVESGCRSRSREEIFLAELAEHGHRGLDGSELAIGIKDVEFAVVASWPKAAPVSAVASRRRLVRSKPSLSPTAMVSTMVERRSRSAVKSCRTSTGPPRKIMMATRSAGSSECG